MTEAPDIDERRRSFLAWCATVGVSSTLFPGALWAQSAQGDKPITTAMIAEAARLAGLEFSAEQCEQMLEGVRANLGAFAVYDPGMIDQSTPPPLYFNPAVPGQSFDTAQRLFVLGQRREVRRPARLENVAFWPVTDLATLIKSRQVSSLELTRMYLDRLRRFDSQLNAVVTLTEARALQQAEAMDAELAAGRYRGPLHGIPWGAKDLIAVDGYRTTWGFKTYENQVIELDASVVKRLDEAGAVLVAKLSTGEIARGDYWLDKQTRNPWKTDEGADGSSAGPASATAAGLVAFSLGTDTLGSIVGPARTCGINGLRPTFGRVSRHGVMPVCWSLDKVGPMCRSAEDCALVFAAIQGPDGQDLAVTDKAFNWDGNSAVEGLRVAYLAAAFERETSNASQRAALANDREVLKVLSNMGITPVPVELPADADLDPLQMLLVDESAAFAELMASGDVRYFRQDIDDPEDMLMRVARLYPAVEYVQTNRRRMLLMQDMARLFADIDVLIAPYSGSPQQSATSLTGHPSVAVPNGFDDVGRPTAIQFIAPLYGEAQALSLARHYQLCSDWHTRHPPAFL
jgi:Asp-tRNA(Asn)/Glu-tRNA(Gln) amidotransferase A subunit family amidase